MLVTLHLCVVCGSQKKQYLLFIYIINRLVFITGAESVYSAVRSESLYKAHTFLI